MPLYILLTFKRNHGDDQMNQIIIELGYAELSKREKLNFKNDLYGLNEKDKMWILIMNALYTSLSDNVGCHVEYTMVGFSSDYMSSSDS